MSHFCADTRKYSDVSSTCPSRCSIEICCPTKQCSRLYEPCPRPNRFYEQLHDLRLTQPPARLWGSVLRILPRPIFAFRGKVSCFVEYVGFLDEKGTIFAKMPHTLLCRLAWVSILLFQTSCRNLVGIPSRVLYAVYPCSFRSVSDGVVAGEVLVNRCALCTDTQVL